MPDPKFGGEWTKKKLSVLEDYLDAYTTALKNQSFKLIYIDAFAGSGGIETSRSDVDPSGEVTSFLEGSVARAIRVEDKPFDKLIFVEQNRNHYNKLKRRIEANHPDRDIKLHNGDANEFLLRLERDWNSCRGVLFLDPFATEVRFTTIKKVASFEALDTWILVPVGAILRMLPRNKKPSAISQGLADRLDLVYGDKSWTDLYRPSSQGELFGPPPSVRDPGIEGLLKIYKQKLGEVFGDRLLGESLTLKNSNSAMYELIFCCGNPSPKAIGASKRIAKHLIQAMQDDG